MKSGFLICNIKTLSLKFQLDQPWMFHWVSGLVSQVHWADVKRCPWPAVMTALNSHELQEVLLMAQMESRSLVSWPITVVQTEITQPRRMNPADPVDCLIFPVGPPGWHLSGQVLNGFTWKKVYLSMILNVSMPDVHGSQMCPDDLGDADFSSSATMRMACDLSELSKQPSDGLWWSLVHTFMFLWGWIVVALMIIFI